MEQVQEKVVEMTLEEGKSPASLVPTTVPLVGRGEEGAEDSDSDSEPVVDIDEYKEEEDPVSMGHLWLYGDISTGSDMFSMTLHNCSLVEDSLINEMLTYQKPAIAQWWTFVV